MASPHRQPTGWPASSGDSSAARGRSRCVAGPWPASTCAPTMPHWCGSAPPRTRADAIATRPSSQRRPRRSHMHGRTSSARWSCRPRPADRGLPRRRARLRRRGSRRQAHVHGVRARAREPSRVADAEHACAGLRDLAAGARCGRIGRPRQLVAPRSRLREAHPLWGGLSPTRASSSRPGTLTGHGVSATGRRDARGGATVAGVRRGRDGARGRVAPRSRPRPVRRVRRRPGPTRSSSRMARPAARAASGTSRAPATRASRASRPTSVGQSAARRSASRSSTAGHELPHRHLPDAATTAATERARSRPSTPRPPCRRSSPPA